MLQVKHPFIGHPQLVWQDLDDGGYRAAVRRQAKYWGGNPYDVDYWFASVRPAFAGDGLATDTGWVVSRQSFGQLKMFNSLAEAKRFVESLYEFEKQ